VAQIRPLSFLNAEHLVCMPAKRDGRDHDLALVTRVGQPAGGASQASLIALMRREDDAT